MKLPRKSTLFGITTYGLVLLLLGMLVLQSVQFGEDTAEVLHRLERIEVDTADQTRRNGQEVAEHRKANQSDHDCIVALALLLADPARNRGEAVVPPAICERSPAADGESR